MARPMRRQVHGVSRAARGTRRGRYGQQQKHDIVRGGEKCGTTLIAGGGENGLHHSVTYLVREILRVTLLLFDDSECAKCGHQRAINGHTNQQGALACRREILQLTDAAKPLSPHKVAGSRRHNLNANRNDKSRARQAAGIFPAWDYFRSCRPYGALHAS